MSHYKALCVFGTRPEVIKLWPIIVAGSKRDEVTVETCFTGQHRDLGPQMLSLLNITPDYSVDVMRDGQSLAQLTGRLAMELDAVYDAAKPDIVFVQGDTTTVLMAALTAFYRRIKVGHVEAGLRTQNKFSPFPEEINRRLVSPMADYHFAPTEQAKANLLSEGIAPQSIFVTGNTAIDALLLMLGEIDANRVAIDPNLPKIPAGDRMVLITAHRRENFGDGIRNICMAMKALVDRFPDVHLVYPVHPNPNVLEPVRRLVGDHPRIHLIKPCEYASFVQLMRRSYLILTDSGGIQEEAPSLGKPVLVMRDTTERPEGIAAGTVKLIGTSMAAVIDESSRLLMDRKLYESMAGKRNPYGDGRAADNILNILAQQM